jgi:hypothetical protein
MKIEIESTTKIVELNGVPARIWEGKTASGIPVHCYITRIAVANRFDTTEFDLAELQEHRAPSPEIEAIPLRMVL